MIFTNYKELEIYVQNLAVESAPLEKIEIKEVDAWLVENGTLWFSNLENSFDFLKRDFYVIKVCVQFTSAIVVLLKA